jgi:hypothetical protein
MSVRSEAMISLSIPPFMVLIFFDFMGPGLTEVNNGLCSGLAVEGEFHQVCAGIPGHLGFTQFKLVGTSAECAVLQEGYAATLQVIYFQVN